MRTWSVVQTVSQPTRSASSAAATIDAGVARSVKFGRQIP